MIDEAKDLDDIRLILAALEVGYNRGKSYIDDPLGKFTDIISVNECQELYADLPYAKAKSTGI